MNNLNFETSGLTRKEWNKLKSLNTPTKIQNYLNSIPFNFEKHGETHTSVIMTLKRNKAHCFEGALLAAAALWIQGQPPLLLDLKTIRPDFDHVVALFRDDSKSAPSRFWGAISKTNHNVLRYREPIYRDVRELTLSYFHEYFLLNGKKTLRQYSEPFDLSKVGNHWLATKENLADLAHELDTSPHHNILNTKQTKSLRKADKVEIDASELTEWQRS